VRYDVYGPYHGKIRLEQLVPKLVPLWREKVEKKGVSRVREHVRAERMSVLNLFTGEMEERVKPLPREWKSVMEISCRNYCCPYPFNIDPFESGGCFNCVYCFSIFTKSSIYSSWFDGDPWIPRFPRRGHVTEVLTDVLRARDVEPRSRPREDPDRPPKWAGTVGDVRALKKAAAQGIPLRMGNRGEPFFPPERQHGATLEALRVIRDFDYPLIINTKGDLCLEEPYFSLITDLSKVAIQVSIIHNDDAVAKRLEPGAPSSTRRWEVIKTFNEVGVRALPRMEPIMAFISDGDEHLEAYAESAEAAGVTNALMDSYSYTARSPEIKKAFEAGGFDFDRMFEACSEWTVLGSYMIQKAAYYLKMRGIKTSTFDFNCIPYNDTRTCCCIDDYFGTWYHYNTYTATDLIVDGEPLGFKEFDERFWGEELTPGIRQRVRDVWNLRVLDPWAPIYCEGVYIDPDDPKDEDGNYIYRFDPDRLGREYERIIQKLEEFNRRGKR